MAEAIGEGRSRGWIDDEAGDFLYRRVNDEFKSTKRAPSGAVMRKRLLQAHNLKNDVLP